jgi:hypothetical protein
LLLVEAAAGRIFPAYDPDRRALSTLREWIESSADRFERTEENMTLLRQVLGAVLASDLMQPREGDPAERLTTDWGLFRTEFPHLEEHIAREQFAVFRQLGSSMTYIAFRTDFGLSSEAATNVIVSTLRRLADELSDLDEKASRRERT